MTEIVIALLSLPDGRLVFQRRDDNTKISPGKLALFGGHIERGEQPEEAIRRELGEETSLDVPRLDLMFAGDYKIVHTDLDSEESHYYLYKAVVENADFAVYEGSGAEAYSTDEALPRSDLTNSARYAIVNLLGEK